MPPRETIPLAAVMGASLAWPPELAAGVQTPIERQDRFPLGVRRGPKVGGADPA